MIKTNVLVIGGGVAGLSTAYFLGKSGERSVMVIEQESALGGHASGRNAGMLRQALSDPILTRLAKKSRDYFDSLSSRGWSGIQLKKNGSLLLANKEQASELNKTERSLRQNGVECMWLSHREATRRVPVLVSAEFKTALFCPADALLELTPLLSGFVKHLLKMGIPILTGRAVRSIKKTRDGFIVKTQKDTFVARKIVNAAGAWASTIAKQAGASKIPLTAYRRHLFLAPNSQLPTPNFQKWPFVWDLSTDFYFRPMKEGILLSPCDKTLEKMGDRREKINPIMKKVLRSKMKAFSPLMDSWRATRPKSGLRTMTPDGRFVIGEDKKQKGFFWVAGLGGHGVTTCFSVGDLAARMVLGRKVDATFKKALSPGRFRS